jgi:hypothetical protein
MNVREKIGSYTAKGGFENERNIVKKINNWKKDSTAQEWLYILGYDFEKIASVKAIKASIRKDKAVSLGVTEDKLKETKKFKKADVQVQVRIEVDGIFYLENISLKKANRKAGFNQIDKRKVETYQEMWGFNSQVSTILKLFTGEIKPNSDDYTKLSKNNRVKFTEMPQEEVDAVIDFITENKHKIINDILQGRGALKADWMLVTCKEDDGSLNWVLKDMVEVCNFYSMGDVITSPRGSLKIGRVTMQRKGGTPDPTSLQFKCNPLELFEG